MKTKNIVIPTVQILTLEAIVTDATTYNNSTKILLQSIFSMKTSALISNQSNVQGKEEQTHASSTLRFNLQSFFL